jgi:hypothetical protein
MNYFSFKLTKPHKLQGKLDFLILQKLNLRLNKLANLKFMVTSLVCMERKVF